MKQSSKNCGWFCVNDSSVDTPKKLEIYGAGKHVLQLSQRFDTYILDPAVSAELP